MNLYDFIQTNQPVARGGGAKKDKTPDYGFGQMSSDPFSSAMSGNLTGTLQPYINQQTNNAYQSLYGGLLGYAPQPMQAGNASGTPLTMNNPLASQFNIQGLLSNFNGFGNRSWMDQ